MVSKHEKNEVVGSPLVDGTEEVKRAFLSTNQHDLKDRSSFLEETKTLGVMSPSGKWLIQNAAEGKIAQSPVSQKELSTDANNEGCLCPKCTCSVDEIPSDGEYDIYGKTWTEIKDPGTKTSGADLGSTSTVSRPLDAFTP